MHFAWVQGDVCKVPAVHASPPLLVSLYSQTGSGRVVRVRTAPHACHLAQVVRYEAGYVVCAVIAGLYLLLVPIAGLCFCCCRCRRRCGGRVKTEHKAMACERGTLMVFLLLTTLVLL